MVVNRYSRHAVIVAILAGVIGISSCEQTLDPDNPYVERLVVQGFVEADSVPQIYITRTTSLLEPIHERESWIRDVVAAISVDGQSYPLEYRDSGRYVAAGLVGAVGKTYRLDATWKNHTITATTVVPPRGRIIEISPTVEQIDSVLSDPNSDLEVSVLVEAPTKAAYQLAAYYMYQTTREDGSLQIVPFFLWMDRWDAEIVDPKAVGDDGRLRIERDNSSGIFFPIGRDGEPSLDSLTFRVYAYDPEFHAFWKSYDPYSDDGPFSSGTDRTKWNVVGDGIGTFFGRSAADTTLRR